MDFTAFPGASLCSLTDLPLQCREDILFGKYCSRQKRRLLLSHPCLNCPHIRLKKTGQKKRVLQAVLTIYWQRLTPKWFYKKVERPSLFTSVAPCVYTKGQM